MILFFFWILTEKKGNKTKQKDYNVSIPFSGSFYNYV